MPWSAWHAGSGDPRRDAKRAGADNPAFAALAAVVPDGDADLDDADFGEFRVPGCAVRRDT